MGRRAPPQGRPVRARRADAPRPVGELTAPLVLVDARNVLRSQWPNIPEGRVVELVRDWSRREGLPAVVVFDGAAPGGVVGEEQLDEVLAVVGTGRESADDWLIRRAGELAAAGTAFWLVTSDRALRAAAGAHAERTIGGGSFARELQREP